MKNKNFLSYNTFENIFLQQKRLVMEQGGPKEDIKSPDAPKRTETVPSRVEGRNLDENREEKVKKGADAVTKAEQLADSKENAEKAKSMVRSKLDDAMNHFKNILTNDKHPEKFNNPDFLHNIVKDYIGGLTSDPNFPGMDKIEDFDFIESTLSHAFPGTHGESSIYFQILRSKDATKRRYVGIAITSKGVCPVDASFKPIFVLR